MGVDPSELDSTAVRARPGASVADALAVPARWRSVWARAYDRAARWSVRLWTRVYSEALP